jgi:hypothetical protein
MLSGLLLVLQVINRESRILLCPQHSFDVPRFLERCELLACDKFELSPVVLLRAYVLAGAEQFSHPNQQLNQGNAFLSL